LKARELELVAAVEAFDGADVLLADGSRISPDVVIAATGYRSNLPELVGHLGVLDPRGWPAVERGSDHPGAPGIFFSGYWASMTGQLRHIRIDARRVARTIARRLRGARWPSPAGTGAVRRPAAARRARHEAPP
jgi:putative flavoprotein involved in K+ transport